MLAGILVAAAAFVCGTQAHYSLEYPEWRADSFEDPYNQALGPCAGINSTSNTTRTEWPLDGGSVVLELHHPWDYIFVNLGLGSPVTSFNISLTPNFFNNTGNGTLCLPKIGVPASLNVQDGDKASIQVVTVGVRGTGLYNCADIVFRKNATVLASDKCQNTTEGPLFVVGDQTTGNDTEGGSDKPSAAVHGSSPAFWTASFTILMAVVVASGLL